MTQQLILYYLGYIMLTDFELGSFGLSMRAHVYWVQMNHQLWCHL